MARVALLMAMILMTSSECESTPAYFASVANQVLRLEGGPLLGGGSLRAVSGLEQQVKRVMGADPALDLNVSSLRELQDPDLLRILFLAVLGNFTSAAAGDWQQPCQLVVDTHSGLIRVLDTLPVASLALKVVVTLLVAVQFKQWVSDVRAKQAATPEAASNGQRHDDAHPQKGKGH
jgi:hypothetical protein